MRALSLQIGMPAVFAALLTIASFMEKTACADEPQYVLRTFAFVTLEGELLPDFQGDDSLAIVVTNDANPGQWTLSLLGYSDVETTWLSHKARHVTIGGKEIQGDFLWLVDDDLPTPPPVGAISLTGPDGMIDSVFIARISQCSSYDCGPGNQGKWHVSPTGTRRVVFARAWFLR